MRQAAIAFVLVLAVVGNVFAQSAPPASVGTQTQESAVNSPQSKVTPNGATVAPPAVPQLSAQDQQTYVLMTFKAQVQTEAIAVLQKELDSTNAEIGRLVQRLQKEGYDLSRDPQTGRLFYVAKPTPEPKK